MWPPSRRRPTSTATSATARVDRNSSANAERKAIRSVPIVARRWSSPTRRRIAACALALRNTARVGSPSTTSRKCPPRRLSSRHCRSVRCWVYMPINAMNTGISGSVTRTTIPEIQSAQNTTARTASGTIAARTSWGR